MVERAHSHAQQLTDTAEVQHKVRGELQLQQLRRGVGVDDEQYLTCLRNMHAYLRLSSNGRSKSALRQLSGLRVIVGSYLGVSDDGSCIIPWDMNLPE